MAETSPAMTASKGFSMRCSGARFPYLPAPIAVIRRAPRGANDGAAAPESCSISKAYEFVFPKITIRAILAASIPPPLTAPTMAKTRKESRAAAPLRQIAAEPGELRLPKPAAEDGEAEIFRPASP